MRAVFVINSWATGGAEQVLAQLLAPRWRHGEPVLVTLDDVPDLRATPDVPRVRLAAGGSLAASAWHLRAALDRLNPDVVVSFLIRANCANVLAGIGRGWATVLCERMHMSAHLATQLGGWRRRAALALPRLLYRHADARLAVSAGARDDLARITGLPPARIGLIGYPYDASALAARGALPRVGGEALPDDYIVAVGRLVPAKNMALVISAFAAARPARDLVILGEGPERAALMALAGALGVDDHVHLPGFVDNPHAWMARARCLVSGSRNEGFPNAIAEAMALGVPVISTDCPSGPRELLADGRHGLLVPMDDVAAMTAAMRALDPATAARLGESGRARIADFAIEHIAPRYWEVFANAAAMRVGAGATTRS